MNVNQKLSAFVTFSTTKKLQLSLSQVNVEEMTPYASEHLFPPK